MLKRKALQVAIAAITFAGMHGTAQANGADMVNPEGGVVVGYWHNWDNGGGYKGGNAPAVKLSEVHPDYNVIDVSFMKVYDTAEGRIPTFKLDPATGLTEEQFIAEISDLNAQGRAVLIALGGADAHIELKTGDEQAFADELIRLTDKYGFDGLDIDLEQSAVTAANNQTVIPAALRMVKDHYKKQGKNFLITMAAEFPYLTSGGKYLPYLEGLDGYYDWINPQFYNQGGDGVYVDNVGWIAQNNDKLKEEFIYYISDSIVNGTRGFSRIPHDKLVFGIPSSNDAAATGFIQDPQDLYDAFNKLAKQGQPLRGVMTWSINWDMGTDAAGTPYNSQFIKNYGSFVHNMDTGATPPPVVEGKPVITGATDVRIAHGNAFDAMAGVHATDKEDGNLTSSVHVDGMVDTSRVGSYSLTYSVTDSDNNTTTVKRVVEVHSEKPVFTGVDSATVLLGAAFDPRAGVTASDAEDGDLTSKIKVVTNTVDTSVMGVYKVEYSVQDSANQIVTAERKVTVTDGATCVNAWNAAAVYNTGDVASHNGSEWEAQWWVQGEEPGTTGEWGVWRVVGDSTCGGGSTPPTSDAELTISGLATEYTADASGQVNLALVVTTNEQMSVDASVVDSSGRIVAHTNITVVESGNINLTITDAKAGSHTLTVTGTTEAGEKDMVNANFKVNVAGDVTPPGGDYPAFEEGTTYNAGDIVQGADGGLYECKPWPYTSWCSLGAYAPGVGSHWGSAWDKR